MTKGKLWHGNPDIRTLEDNLIKGHLGIVKLLSPRRANKLRFYARSFSEWLFVPNVWFRNRLNRVLERMLEYDSEDIQGRVNYYNRLSEPFNPSADSVTLKSLTSTDRSAYYFDYRSILRYFPPDVKCDVIFGDVRDTATHPTFVKSREITENNGNNILLKLNQVRHFIPIKDRIPFRKKKNLLVWRGAAWQPQPQRKAFLNRYHEHPLCDVGQVNAAPEGVPVEWVKPKLSIAEQLRYKFIISIEGNDVATNLKWIAQSNSLCFMAKPKFETWMMEGRLVDGEHFVELRDDYADLEEKISYYIGHQEEAEHIINNFQKYFHQFTEPQVEELVSLLVVQKYLELSGQSIRG